MKSAAVEPTEKVVACCFLYLQAISPFDTVSYRRRRYSISCPFD